MKTRRTQPVPGGMRPGEAVILFTVGGTAFAIAATAVEEIRNTEGLRALAPSSPWANVPKVRHCLERSGRPYCVVDASFHFHMLPTAATRLMVLRHPAVAVLVGGIDRIAEIQAIHPVPRAFTGEELCWYRGLALMSGHNGETEIVPVVNPDAFFPQSEGRFATPQAQPKGGA